MTKRLILMRHAKSGWDDPLLSDIERPLNERGRKSATALGVWLSENGYLPDEVLCSSATRTGETFSRLAIDTPVTFKPDLYLASPNMLLKTLKQGTGDTVLMLAHNPGIAEFAEGILAAHPDHSRFLDYPTGATLVCDLPIEKWADAVPRSAHPVDFVIPRDLTD
ncbi:histidine phosphatase family protein [Octadecabacter sp. 1_MG-2023]|uniref:SixA phosphatase family protein n=1 Tax=unclassified Octadecabacter TaxID=196158 RepID=UPI001C0915FD|nr:MULTISPECIES: histidine phosphatase family protein [unclassified Octadecabacter]MBU2991643.1 histidine phosphatase family protein [Octadecabacter sp. B2R22]MDO6736169.1 histidine phosphatase family protein [Octadecabacter sp. 1_MG-2023]